MKRDKVDEESRGEERRGEESPLEKERKRKREDEDEDEEENKRGGRKEGGRIMKNCYPRRRFLRSSKKKRKIRGGDKGKIVQYT